MNDKTLQDRINAHLRQLAPHMKERASIKLLVEARDEIAKLTNAMNLEDKCLQNFVE